MGIVNLLKCYGYCASRNARPGGDHMMTHNENRNHEEVLVLLLYIYLYAPFFSVLRRERKTLEFGEVLISRPSLRDFEAVLDSCLKKTLALVWLNIYNLAAFFHTETRRLYIGSPESPS
ncbi:uncharacterized [Tachysurus ichikawai]